MFTFNEINELARRGTMRITLSDGSVYRLPLAELSPGGTLRWTLEPGTGPHVPVADHLIPMGSVISFDFEMPASERDDDSPNANCPCDIYQVSQILRHEPHCTK